MLPFFEYTEVDKAFYRDHIAPRLPSEIFDVHVHAFLQKHVDMVPEDVRTSFWASECAVTLSCDDAHACACELYPDSSYAFAAFPTATPEADTIGMNEYIADMGRAGKCVPLMMVRPEWDPEEVERIFIEGNFAGLKPYPGMVGGSSRCRFDATGGTTGEVSIFSFFPHEQWEILNRHHKALMLHVGRKERFADANNIRELLIARDRYPEVTIIIAHFGRSYCPWYLERGLDMMGDPSGFYFDTTAVINPAVYDIAFERIPAGNILYGSDMHVLLWHGKREWTEKSYKNLTRENYTWNTDRRPPDEEATYTLFLYEQMKSILDAVDRHTLTDRQKRDIFGANARRALGVEDVP